jgi:hypothetical protein
MVMITAEQKVEARHLWEVEGLSGGEIGIRLGLTKNTIAGMAHRGEWMARGPRSLPTTVFQRCDALHAKLDAVLAETVGVGKIPAWSI